VIYDAILNCHVIDSIVFGEHRHTSSSKRRK